jgi:serine/threonine-protein kinase HipA
VTDTLTVLLEEKVAGTLSRLSDGRLRFDYEPAYQEQPTPTPLSLSMPAQVASHPDRVVRPWLWGLLPDDGKVLRSWAQEFQVSASSPFSLLSTPVGEDCAGSVRFIRPADVAAELERPGEVTWLSEEDVGRRLQDLREDSTAWLGHSFSGQFSLAGAQAKTALLFAGERWGEPSGSVPTTHILKPGAGGFEHHDLDEHLCLDAARRVGLVAARTTVSRFAAETAVVVRRYDRRAMPDGRVVRVHQEDLCQALGIPPERKYQAEGGPTPAQIARLLRESMPAAVAEEAVWRFADALIWNWLIAGTDAHAKNYSLLLSGSQVRLAPLYDVSSALPYMSAERKLRLAMKVGGTYDVDSRRDPWPTTAGDLTLDPGALIDRARELAAIVGEAFAAAAAAEPAVTAIDSELPATLVDLVGERASRCETLLART